MFFIRKKELFLLMKIRSSENPHNFQEKLFRRLQAYSLQGLLMNDKHDFTAAVEAVEYENGDNKTKIPFTENDLYARYILAKQVGIPFYILCYMDKIYKIIKVDNENAHVKLRMKEQLQEKEFVQWWGELKQTIQKKPLNNGGEPRLGETVFDSVLRRNGYEWGGNIDGFVLTEDGKNVKFIIDNISVSKPNLNDEPSHYFNSKNPKHGPRYEGWYAAVKLAKQIQVPHILFTIDKKNQYQEHIGFTVIDKLTPEGIFFVDNRMPNQNIIEGMENIVRIVNNKILISSPPTLKEKSIY